MKKDLSVRADTCEKMLMILHSVLENRVIMTLLPIGVSFLLFMLRIYIRIICRLAAFGFYTLRFSVPFVFWGSQNAVSLNLKLAAVFFFSLSEWIFILTAFSSLRHRRIYLYAFLYFSCFFSLSCLAEKFFFISINLLIPLRCNLRDTVGHILGAASAAVLCAAVFRWILIHFYRHRAGWEKEKPVYGLKKIIILFQSPVPEASISVLIKKEVIGLVICIFSCIMLGVMLSFQTRTFRLLVMDDQPGIGRKGAAVLFDTADYYVVCPYEIRIFEDDSEELVLYTDLQKKISTEDAAAADRSFDSVKTESVLPAELSE